MALAVMVMDFLSIKKRGNHILLLSRAVLKLWLFYFNLFSGILNETLTAVGFPQSVYARAINILVVYHVLVSQLNVTTHTESTACLTKTPLTAVKLALMMAQ